MPTPQHRRPKLTRAVVAGSWLALAAVVASLVVRFTVRDEIAWIDLFHYGTPPVLCLVTSAAVAALAWRLGRKCLASLAAAVAAACAMVYVLGSFVSNASQPPGALRGLFWNVGRGHGGWTSIAETLHRLDPDVAWISEAGDGGEGADAAFLAALPGRTIVRAGSGLAILVRGEARVVQIDMLGGRGRAARIDVSSLGREFTSLQVDLGAGPGRRGPWLAKVEALAAPLAGTPHLIVGDFNTPRDSGLFDGLRKSSAHAFESAGTGLDATWPMPLPVLSIDHVWTGGGVVVRTCELPWSWASDHLPVLFTFDVE